MCQRILLVHTIPKIIICTCQRSTSEWHVVIFTEFRRCKEVGWEEVVNCVKSGLSVEICHLDSKLTLGGGGGGGKIFGKKNSVGWQHTRVDNSKTNKARLVASAAPHPIAPAYLQRLGNEIYLGTKSKAGMLQSLFCTTVKEGWKYWLEHPPNHGSNKTIENGSHFHLIRSKIEERFRRRVLPTRRGDICNVNYKKTC